ncbi:MAG: hypothetical protein ACOX6T_18195 [Myxococcales bacterium]|jgi:hypothetical protein
MSIRKAVFSLSVALPLALAGCPSDGEDPGTIVNCTSDAECLEGSEICHPIGKVCVPTCTIADDCPDTQKNCMEVKDATGAALTTEKVCQCETSELCKGEDELAEVVCSTVDNICEATCATDADCADFTNTNRECVGGQCVLKATCSATSCTDPSASKCGEDGACGACTVDADCAHIEGLNTCESGVCVAPSCNANNKAPGSAFGPDICAYGEVCDATNGCIDVAAPTCSGAASHVWAKDAKPPVIVKIVSANTSSTSNTSGECGDGGPKSSIVFEFYAPNGFTWADGQALLDSVKFVSSSGQTLPASFVKGATKGMTNGTLTAGQCFGSVPNLSGRWMYMESGAKGNAMCLQ